MNLTEKVIEAIKDNLGELEVQAINELLKDRDALAEANKKIEHLEKAKSDLNEKSENTFSQIRESNSEIERLKKDIQVLKTDLEGYKEREVELRVSESLIPLHSQYSDRAFQILEGGFKHYVQKTTQQVPVKVAGSFYTNPDGSGVCMDGGEMIDTIEKTVIVE